LKKGANLVSTIQEIRIEQPEESQTGKKAIVVCVIVLLLLLPLIQVQIEKSTAATAGPEAVMPEPRIAASLPVIAARKEGPVTKKMESLSLAVAQPPSTAFAVGGAIPVVPTAPVVPMSVPVVPPARPAVSVVVKPSSSKHQAPAKQADRTRSVTARSALAEKRPGAYAAGTGNPVASNSRPLPSHRYSPPKYRQLPDSYYRGLLGPMGGGPMGGMGGVHMGGMGGGHMGGHMGGGHHR
jgi:hypothetical protein